MFFIVTAKYSSVPLQKLRYGPFTGEMDTVSKAARALSASLADSEDSAIALCNR